MNEISGSRPLGGGVLASTPAIDMVKLRAYRLERVRQELRRERPPLERTELYVFGML